MYLNLTPSREDLKKAGQTEVPTGAAKFTYKVENTGKNEMGGFDLGLPSTDIAKVLCSSLLCKPHAPSMLHQGAIFVPRTLSPTGWRRTTAA